MTMVKLVSKILTAKSNILKRNLLSNLKLDSTVEFEKNKKIKHIEFYACYKETKLYGAKEKGPFELLKLDKEDINYLYNKYSKKLDKEKEYRLDLLNREYHNFNYLKKIIKNQEKSYKS